MSVCSDTLQILYNVTFVHENNKIVYTQYQFLADQKSMLLWLFINHSSQNKSALPILQYPTTLFRKWFQHDYLPGSSYYVNMNSTTPEIRISRCIQTTHIYLLYRLNGVYSKKKQKFSQLVSIVVTHVLNKIHVWFCICSRLR